MAFNTPDYTGYYNQQYSNLESYYQRILDEAQGDVNRAKQRMVEDYQRGSRVINEDYTRSTEFAQATAGASQKELGLDSLGETRRVEGDLVRRGIQYGGAGDTLRQETKSRQDLRREAIDRALKKNEEDLKYSKERGLEEETIKQRRGTEDVAVDYGKLVTQKNQERQEKAAQLAEQTYSREFAKRSAEESFRLQNQVAG